jgi:hypothetical protein
MDTGTPQTHDPGVSRLHALPLALLCGVATVHTVRVYALDQSTWGAGAGFGMYARLDAHPTRFVRARGTLADGTVLPLRIPEDLRWYADHLQVVPTRSNCRRMAARLLEHTWVARDGGLEESGEGARLSRAEVEVWGVGFAEDEIRAFLKVSDGAP